uniref:mRNA (guanine-N(7))-methyltransferase n=1 Tax=Chromera velia CCMP2878 TaxID=1169474 RepID=A0A0G4HWL6_9ALVE|eukprot:Cvel_9070.t1-p1 / transcript=Cvel_9070.t1 / gene=Cvel_9070 / organism=Chromera_velia_CCMP2878 / gene_product=mRNA cap guanine-N7 methyltransferase, putative / transcript_product=mRNA cap guanine-N7 methyltransferase, putative / location=Cvel_scaffold514:58920-62139(-) / protein_length=792 / sequence_SO=supercontig / SO=protein_coding / is_pseudo=false
MRRGEVWLDFVRGHRDTTPPAVLASFFQRRLETADASVRLYSTMGCLEARDSRDRVPVRFPGCTAGLISERELQGVESRDEVSEEGLTRLLEVARECELKGSPDPLFSFGKEGVGPSPPPSSGSSFWSVSLLEDSWEEEPLPGDSRVTVRRPKKGKRSAWRLDVKESTWVVRPDADLHLRFLAAENVQVPLPAQTEGAGSSPRGPGASSEGNAAGGGRVTRTVRRLQMVEKNLCEGGGGGGVGANEQEEGETILQSWEIHMHTVRQIETEAEGATASSVCTVRVVPASALLSSLARARDRRGMVALSETFLGLSLAVSRILTVLSSSSSSSQLEQPSVFFASGGGSSVVQQSNRDHYDHQKSQKVKAREDEKTGDARLTNNLIKGFWISQWSQAAVRDRGRLISVLELAGGRGQDMLKYPAGTVRSWLCVDHSPVQIEEGRERARRNVEQRRIDFIPEFMVGDLKKEETWEMLRRRGPFDFVSMQLAIHYFLDTREETVRFLHRLSKLLTVGGTFLFTTVDCEEIGRRMEESGRREADADTGEVLWRFGNQRYSISFDEQTVEAMHRFPAPAGTTQQTGGGGGVSGDSMVSEGESQTGERTENQDRSLSSAAAASTAMAVCRDSSERDGGMQRFPEGMKMKKVLAERFGLAYSFWLDGAIETVQEFVVPSEALVNLCKQLSAETREDGVLRLQDARSFSSLLYGELREKSEGEWVRQDHRGNPDVRGQAVKRILREENKSQREVVTLYKAFCFKKMSEGIRITGLKKKKKLNPVASPSAESQEQQETRQEQQ